MQLAIGSNLHGSRDYFDEWLERIRKIRASEKRFYQKVRDIYATAIYYDAKSDQAQIFFKKVQNKILWAHNCSLKSMISALASFPSKTLFWFFVFASLFRMSCYHLSINIPANFHVHVDKHSLQQMVLFDVEEEE